MPKKHSRKSAQAEINPRRLIAFAGMFIIFVTAMIGFSTRTASASVTYQALVTPTAQSEVMNESLVYLETDGMGGGQTLIQKSKKDIETGGGNRMAFAAIDTGACSVGGIYPAPHGQWIAIEQSCEDGGIVEIFHLASGKFVSSFRDVIFLGWTPKNDMIIKGGIVDRQVYLVNPANGKESVLPVPSTTYHVSISRNGKQMVYSTTIGLGYGSETWVSDIDGDNAMQIHHSPNSLILFATWSPNQKQIAYIEIPDTNIPFEVGELWVIDSDGSNPTFLSKADGGHGYQLSWSSNGKRIAFVGRENPSDSGANFEDDRLVSEIYIVDVSNGKIQKVSNFSRKTGSPSWSHDGKFIIFETKKDAKSNEIWVYNTETNSLDLADASSNGSLPVWLVSP